MAIFKSREPQFCRCCGKGLRKWSITVYVRRGERTAYEQDKSYCRYIHPASDLRSKEDCQVLSNQIVISVKYGVDKDALYNPVPGSRHIVEFAEWDGESWSDQYFCGVKCASQFAYAILAASPSWTTKAYRDAVAKHKKPEPVCPISGLPERIFSGPTEVE